VCCQEADRKSVLHYGFSLVCVRAETGQTADASGSTPSPFQDDVYYVSGSPGSGKSHLAQAIGQAVIAQGLSVIYREAHILLEEIAEAALDGNRKEHMELLATVPLLIIDDLTTPAGLRSAAFSAGKACNHICIMQHREITLSTKRKIRQT